jgi:very-short-patch-repair endonuclease
MNFKQLEKLKQQGKIKGFVGPAVCLPGGQGGVGGTGRTVHTNKKSKGLEWLEWNLMYWANEKGLILEREYEFSDRKFRFDFCFPALKLAIEFEGGIFIPKSGHNTAKHYTKDTFKYNLATIKGFRILRYTAMNYTSAINDLNLIYGDIKNG